MKYTLSIVLLAVVSFFSIIMLLLLFAPVIVIKPNIQPYKVVTPEVKRNTQLIYIVDACKYMDVSSTVSRQFVEVKKGTEYPALVEPNNIRAGCGATNVVITVPMFLPPGRYYLKLDIAYKVNALTEKLYHFTTEQFSVIK